MAIKDYIFISIKMHERKSKASKMVNKKYVFPSKF